MQVEVVEVRCDLCRSAFYASPVSAPRYRYKLPVLYRQDDEPECYERVESREVDLCGTCLRRVIAIRAVAKTRSTYIGGHDMAYVNQPTGKEEYSFIKEDE